MNFRHALGFFFVGAVCALIPRYAPELCDAAGFDGSSARQIWLQIMSLVLMGLGLAHFARRTLVGLASLLEYTPPTLAPVPARAAQPAFRPVVAAAGIPTLGSLKGGLLNQRRAA
jgi:hypothetical protein